MPQIIQREQTTESTGDEWLQQTELFRQWAAMKQEILVHKWYESEKAGYDVGFDRAATNWMIHHRPRFSPRQD
jgi:hypothetical protein